MLITKSFSVNPYLPLSPYPSLLLWYTYVQCVYNSFTNFQRVQDDYTSRGWVKHHTQWLEYEETSGEDRKPSTIFEVAEPANDKQKDWDVTVITANRVSCTCSL